MPALYRKYRPQSFSDVVGQEPIVLTLMHAVAQNKPAHAYLFTGTRGVGKTTLARLFAKALNCQNQKDGEVCGKCAVCTAVAAGNYLDLVEIDAASNTGVENVRELIEHVKFRPSLGQYKVFIIDEAHMLSKQAFNALLKTLEEPPSHAVFILATTESYKLPATIISRTQRFDFGAISQQEIVKQIELILAKEKIKISNEVITQVANGAKGSLRDALSILDKVIALGSGMDKDEVKLFLGITDFESQMKLFELISKRKAHDIPELFEKFNEQGVDYLVLNKDFLEFLRQVLLIKISGDTSIWDLHQKDASTSFELIQSLSLGQLIKIIRLFLRSYKEINQSPDPQFPMLLAAIEASMDGGVPQSHTQEQVKESSQAEEVDMKTQSSKNTEKPSTVEPAVLERSTMSQAEINSVWPEVLSQIRIQNSPLATLVKNSPIVSVEHGNITIEVKYLFHKEHLESKKNSALILGVIEAISGQKFGLSVVVKKEDLPEVHPAEALGNVLQVFGGELVD